MRPAHPPNPRHGPTESAHTADRNRRSQRLNVLLSSSDWQDETWADRLPRLLEPLGVNALRVHSGREASQVLAHHPVHIAVVDLALPLDTPQHTNQPHDTPRRDQAPPPATPEGGHRLLQLLARQPRRAPTLVIKRRKSQREDARELARVLSAGAFAVLERPVNLEIVLQSLQRALCRYYADAWPDENNREHRHPPRTH